MSQSRAGRWARRVVWGTLGVVMVIGCSPLTTIAFLTHRDTKTPAECPLTFKEGPKKDKDEIVVAIFIGHGPGVSPQFAGSEGVLASELAKKLPELAKENKQKLTILPAAQVNKFKMQNPAWKNLHPTKWGRELGADFVLDVHIDVMRLYQPGSLDQLYEGRAEVSVDTYDVDSSNGEPKFNYVYPFAYPKTGVRDASSMPLRTFKQHFIENLAVEIARKHIDHKPSSGIAEGDQ